MTLVRLQAFMRVIDVAQFVVLPLTVPQTGVTNGAFVTVLQTNRIVVTAHT